MAEDKKEHWDKVYAERKPDEVSWYQAEPTVSLELIQGLGLSQDAAIIDVGGGASVLVDRLLALGYGDLSVLDISNKALDYSRQRLGAAASKVTWLVADVTAFSPSKVFDLWHDRAVFHFLTDAKDREAYVLRLRQGLRAGGHLILASFAPDGPEKCSGLPVCRYDANTLQAALGPGFKLLTQRDETHTTPWDTQQRFSYFVFERA